MFMPSAWLLLLAVFASLTHSYRVDERYVQWNLNQKEGATDPLDYWGEWTDKEYTPSPDSWRFPFYTIFLDRFVNGDPVNDNWNATAFEHDLNSNQMRHGGDLQGLVDTLDYLQGMGVKGLYIAGSPFINQPWGYDQYSPLDLSILDPHFGTLSMWRTAIDEIHARKMYVVLDNTFATLGDLIGFEGYLNTTTPFTLKEHKVMWKDPNREYYDFSISNDYNETCDYPRFWNETGFPIDQSIRNQMVGCYASDFDQYGDTEAFGVFPDWRRELSKFASVQDRLREWHAPVRAKIENFYCMAIAQLDVDGFRYDKATQSTVDAMGYMNDAMRKCARRFGKENFFLPGEITGGNDFGSVFIGRGRQPNQVPENLTEAVMLTGDSPQEYFIREQQHSALDSAAFHYTTYRSLTRFLGMDGNLEAGYDAPLNWVDQWNTFLGSNDFTNANTGAFDPRHMYGVTNQDVFRWPAITNGVQRQLLGHFVTTLLMPGIPLLLWGEEQSFYVLDNTASNYIFGRQAMSTATAWQTHGCYALDSTQYYFMPLDDARRGCSDDKVSLDHRDPSAPVRNIIKQMYHLRDTFPVLNDGFFLQQLSNRTGPVYYPGSSGLETETGMWSVMRNEYAAVQDLSTMEPRKHRNHDAMWYLTHPNYTEPESDEVRKEATPVWLVYSNLNVSRTYGFDCDSKDTDLNSTALIAPFDSGVTVKNLLHPFDEHTLKDSVQFLGIGGSTKPNGCLGQLDMKAYDFRAYVPIHEWIAPPPMITKFWPGHDARILSQVDPGTTESVEVALSFNTPMDCDSVTESITFESKTENGGKPSIDLDSVQCKDTIDWWPDNELVGGVPSSWHWSANLTGVGNGVHSLTVRNASSIHGKTFTNSNDKFLFRVGSAINPIVFPRNANYSSTLLITNGDGKMLLNHSAAGADQYRYSTNWGSSFTDWMPYQGGIHEIKKQEWSGTSLQSWKGEHVRVEYFSRLGGSSDHVQQADLDSKRRRFPHLFLNGPYNQYGYDAGLSNEVKLVDDYTWSHHFMVEWSPSGALAQLNVWGINPDGNPDTTYVMGDADADSVLDRLPPSALSAVVLNITEPPPRPHLSWRFLINDGDMRFQLQPAGSMWAQLALYILLWVVPIIAAAATVYAFIVGFYGVKFNEVGLARPIGLFRSAFRRHFQRLDDEESIDEKEKEGLLTRVKNKGAKFIRKKGVLEEAQSGRRTVLIATMEYDIEDWAIKIKIGGLGVMAQLMGKNLAHQDLIWVVPCVGGVDYPTDEPSESMVVTILGTEYIVEVQTHKLRNITYVLLDAPVFREQTKAEPYPARMDDMKSAIYYSAWNQCIAQAIERFPIDLYHINDYHGTIAPLYLSSVIPVCLSLHNAEFQGLWPMRTKAEAFEVCSVYNLPQEVVSKYVQFGEIFNLLHAGASYLRVHQQGFGAVGVSKKYGKRAYARYPIFWGLRNVQALPNPDPSDTGEWDKKLPKESDIHVDETFEKERLDLRIKAQEWAGLETNRNAELFVFVGRWSMQKGVDLIADVFPSILESNPNVQLITVGPVIDLYGKFAALKLEKLMEMYPKRVCSKPVFTALPPEIFSGAEFALIPSRDEPFGLVAVEFGRKGALGVGARVGGLGQMPGWWYTVESITTAHLHKQFKDAIQGAMASSHETRAMMRARSAKQRFPVAQWVEDLEILQSTSIRISHKVKTNNIGPKIMINRDPATSETLIYQAPEAPEIIASEMKLADAPSGTLQDRKRKKMLNFSRRIKTDRSSGKPTSLGTKRGPGHVETEDHNDGDADSSLTGGQSFLPPMMDFDIQGVGRTMSSYLDTYEDDPPAEGGQHAAGLLQLQYDILRENGALSAPGSPRGGSPRGGTPRGSVSLHRRIESGARPMTAQSAYYSVRESLYDRPPSLLDSGMSSPASASPPMTPHNPNASFPQIEHSSPDSGADASTGLLEPRSKAMEMVRFDSRPPSVHSAASAMSALSVNSVIGGRNDFKLQKVDPFFTDSLGLFYHEFKDKLETLNGKNSETSNCIEEFLVESEKAWFNDFRNAKLGRLKPRKDYSDSRPTSNRSSGYVSTLQEDDHGMETEDELDRHSLSDQFLLGHDYLPPTGLRKWMPTRFGDWPLYAYLMALGQILAANSYQITLLTGTVGQTASRLYVVSTIFLLSSMGWWYMFRRFQSVLSLSLPFFFYGLAFLLIGMGPYLSPGGREWIQNVGTGFYALASASGYIFFSLNFGDEGGALVKAWIFRACVIQGSQQIYVVALWYWGSIMTRQTTEGVVSNSAFAGTWKITAITIPIAAALWIIGFIMFFGLPSYYRQTPGSMPSFYTSIMKRKVVLWFFVTALIQNFFMSAPYGRNWTFLFASAHVETWQVLLLVVLFFVGVWAAFLALFGYLSKAHSWILPLFAIGLGAPRFAQIWWGTSNIGLYLPWAGGLTVSALASRALWLWLGLLDAIQGVGFGMILLATLTRVHVAFTVMATQVVGSLATILARGVAPNRIGPGPVSPDISGGVSAIWSAWFWVGLILNLLLCVGFAKIFRKEQLQKP